MCLGTLRLEEKEGTTVVGRVSLMAEHWVEADEGTTVGGGTLGERRLGLLGSGQGSQPSDLFGAMVTVPKSHMIPKYIYSENWRFNFSS